MGFRFQKDDARLFTQPLSLTVLTVCCQVGSTTKVVFLEKPIFRKLDCAQWRRTLETGVFHE